MIGRLINTKLFLFIVAVGMILMLSSCVNNRVSMKASELESMQWQLEEAVGILRYIAEDHPNLDGIDNALGRVEQAYYTVNEAVYRMKGY